MSRILDELRAGGLLSGLDLHFATLMARLHGGDEPGLLLGAALASARQRDGHVCLALPELAGQALAPAGRDAVRLPSLPEWVASLRRSPVVGPPGAFRPLILDARGRLYLHRYWQYEQEVVDRLGAWRDRPLFPVDRQRLQQDLCRLFPAGSDPAEPDWQRLAALVAVLRPFSVISGGPGTGKTFTVARILLLLQGQQEGPAPLPVALAAPTGKAAARLEEALRAALPGPGEALAAGGAPAARALTVHRLLGLRPGSSRCRFTEDNPLPYAVVVVDEASMLDLALMARLVRAVAREARLILLGDRDQLASVEAGAVLGDICDTGRLHAMSPGFRKTLEELGGRKVPGPEPSSGAAGGLADNLVILGKSYRFGAASGIGALAAAIRDGDRDGVLRLLRDPAYPDLVWRGAPAAGDLAGSLAARAREEYEPLVRAAGVEEAMAAFSRFRLLCALRHGPFGALRINGLIEEELRAAGLGGGGRPWYRGRPVMVTENDYTLRLFNGDIGIVWPDEAAGGELRLFVPATGAWMRRLSLARLPAHETVFAMTVHKSQGSEFDTAALVLPGGPSPVVTRELLYTAVTRVRRGIEIWAGEEELRAGVRQLTRRCSGLRESLWGPGE